MMLRQALAIRAVQASLAAVAASGLAAAAAVMNAVRIDEMPVAARELPLSLASLELGPRTPVELILQAVAAAPFASDRRLGASSPAAESPASSAESPALAAFDAGQVMLVGTVVDSVAGSFVLVAVPGQGTRVLRVDQVIGGLLLRSIEQGSATFTKVSDGERVMLRVPRSR
jgi:hypothetical protein